MIQILLKGKKIANMSKTDGEQIAALEAKMNDIQTSIVEIKSDIKSILANLAASSTQDALLNKELTNLKNEIIEIKAKQNFWKWLSPTLAAVAGSVMTFLIIQFLNNLK